LNRRAEAKGRVNKTRQELMRRRRRGRRRRRRRRRRGRRRCRCAVEIRRKFGLLGRKFLATSTAADSL